MINTNKVQLFEEFAAGEISNPDQNITPVDTVETGTITVDRTSNVNAPVETKGDVVRAEIIADVDKILTNLETLSKQITEDLDTTFFFEQEGLISESLDSIINFVKQQANFVKGMALINGDFKKLKLEANSDIITGKEHDALKKIDASIDKMKRARDEAKGPKKEAIQQKAIATIAKLKDNKADIQSKFEEAKEAATQALEGIEDKLAKFEENMPGGTEGDLYASTKKRINNEIKMDGLKEKGRVAKEKGKSDAAKEAADELKKIGTRSKEADSAIKELESDVDPKLEANIERVQKEIDREKDQDLAKFESEIQSAKKKLTDGGLTPEGEAKLETKLDSLKSKRDKTLEGIYYLEDYVEDLKAQRAALKGDDYDKKDSKVGSTEDGESTDKESILNPTDDAPEEEDVAKETPIDKAEANLAKAQDKLESDEEKALVLQDELKAKEEELKKAKEEVKDLAPQESVTTEAEENKSSDMEAAAQVAKDEVEEIEKKKEDIENKKEKIETEVIPKDEEKVVKAKEKVDALRKKEIEKIKSDKKTALKKEELSWDGLKESLGLEDKVKIHESFSIADKMRILLGKS